MWIFKTVQVISDFAMAILSSDCCDHNEDGETRNIYEEKPRWMESMRTRSSSVGQSSSNRDTKKPIWKASIKPNSPSMRTYSEGGSLRTQRKRWNVSYLSKVFIKRCFRPRNKSQQARYVLCSFIVSFSVLFPKEDKHRAVNVLGKTSQRKQKLF